MVNPNGHLTMSQPLQLPYSSFIKLKYVPGSFSYLCCYGVSWYGNFNRDGFNSFFVPPHIVGWPTRIILLITTLKSHEKFLTSLPTHSRKITHLDLKVLWTYFAPAHYVRRHTVIDFDSQFDALWDSSQILIAEEENVMVEDSGAETIIEQKNYVIVVTF